MPQLYGCALCIIEQKNIQQYNYVGSQHLLVFMKVTHTIWTLIMVH
jgi:hypothetical protein